MRKRLIVIALLSLVLASTALIATTHAAHAANGEDTLCPGEDLTSG
jgi:hypothetical protein